MKSSNEYVSRIKKRREKIGMSVDEVARKLGVARTTIYRYESAEIEKMPVSVLFDIANILRTNPLYLMGFDCEEDIKLESMTEESMMKPNIDFDTLLKLSVGLEEYLRIKSTGKVKVYGKIAAGQPLEAIEDITEEIVCPWLKDDIDIENIFALQVNGDSMDKVVPDNYYAIFEKQNTVRTGEIAAVIVNGGDATLKKVHLLSNKIILEPLSHNLEHEEQAYKEFDDVRIIGRYIGCVSPYSEN